jgi:cytochrome c peroxidase
MSILWKRILISLGISLAGSALWTGFTFGEGNLDNELSSMLAAAGFTGRIESSLETRLGRRLNPALANLGRLWRSE